MTKSGIQNSNLHPFIELSETECPLLPDNDKLSADFDVYLTSMLSFLKERAQGAHDMLREDLGSIYELAVRIRNAPELFERFALLAEAAGIPRRPKTAEQTLHALFKLVYAPKLASARFCRLKSHWIANSPVEQVRSDLEENGASPKRVKITFEEHSLNALKLGSLPLGAARGLMVWATLRRPMHLHCEVTDVTEY